MQEKSRLYLITPPVIPDLSQYTDQLASALDAGDVACVQLRLKDQNGITDAELLKRAGEKLLPIAEARDVAFLVNDDVALAKSIGADGVHIGQDDMSYAEARKVLGNDASIGVTCHNSIHLAMIAGEAGADYVAFGAFFETQTKKAPTRAEVTMLEKWAFSTTVPCVAIGGITAENCGPLVRAGADFLAVSGAIWHHADGPAAGVCAMNEAIAAV